MRASQYDRVETDGVREPTRTDKIMSELSELQETLRDSILRLENTRERLFGESQVDPKSNGPVPVPLGAFATINDQLNDARQLATRLHTLALDFQRDM